MTAVPGVQFAVTMPRQLPSGRSVWVSYLCPVPGVDLDPAAVRRQLATRLPAHRRPAAVGLLTPTPPGRAPDRVDPTASVPGTGAPRATTAPPHPGCADEDLAVLLPLRRAGSDAPLFCLSPVGGLAWGFAGLARHLGPDRPLYGLQSPALGPDPVLPATMEDWARRYLAEIRRIQPHGPYHLLGWSVGGMLAHTVAVLLRRAGQPVPTVAMLDAHTRPPLATPGGPATAAVLAELGLDTGSVPAPVTAGVLAAIEHARAVLPTFTPGRFHGDLLYFSALRDRRAGLDPDGGWRRHVSGAVHIEPIDAAHIRMTTPTALAHIGPVLHRWMSRPTGCPATPAAGVAARPDTRGDHASRTAHGDGDLAGSSDRSAARR
ncbi:thioesterase domain-containing protein [Rhodococcus aetherivorans]